MGLIAVALTENLLTIWVYFVLMGATIGISRPAVSAMWAELYGVGSIGAIKSVVTALAVFSSALSFAEK